MEINYLSDVINLINKKISENGMRKFAIAASGGVDSTLLLYVFSKIAKGKKLNSLRVFHFNHCSRPECELEEQSVVNFSKQLGLECIIGRLDRTPQSNCENFFREARYNFFNKYLMEGECLVLGHHFDDDLEWNLMQRSKCSSIGDSLYIPEYDGKTFKPFLDSYKSHEIYKIANDANLKWFEDSSNSNSKYERNFLRSTSYSAIKEKIQSFE